MPDESATELNQRLNFRLTTDELARFEKVRAAIQQRLGQNIRVTQKATLLEALSMLEAYYDKLERDRRKR